jgi:hypothetical protein
MAHTTILDQVIRPDINEIKEHLIRQNGRIGRGENAVSEIKSNCAAVQKSKMEISDKVHSTTIRWVMIMGLIITVINVVVGFIK